MLSRFDRKPACDGQTDRIAISISRVSLLTRDKNVYYFDSIFVLTALRRSRLNFGLLFILCVFYLFLFYFLGSM